MDADVLYVGNGEDWKDLRRELRERFTGRCRIHFFEEGDDAALLLTFQQFKVAVLIVESVVKSYPNDDGLEYSQGLRTDGYRGVIILLTESRKKNSSKCLGPLGNNFSRQQVQAGLA